MCVWGNSADRGGNAQLCSPHCAEEEDGKWEEISTGRDFTVLCECDVRGVVESVVCGV